MDGNKIVQYYDESGTSQKAEASGKKKEHSICQWNLYEFDEYINLKFYTDNN